MKILFNLYAIFLADQDGILKLYYFVFRVCSLLLGLIFYSLRQQVDFYAVEFS